MPPALFGADGAGPPSETVPVTKLSAPTLVVVPTGEDDPPIARQQQQTEFVAVSNLGKARNSSIVMIPGQGDAILFRIGSTRYVLRKVRADLDSVGGALVEVLLHADNEGVPGSRLLSLGGPDNPHLNRLGHAGGHNGVLGEGYDNFSSAGYILAANSTYWVVFQETLGPGAASATLRYRDTSRYAEDSGAAQGWVIGDAMYTRSSRTYAFEEGSNTLPVLAIIVEELTSLNATSITSSPLGGDTYKAGENLEVEFTFSDPVAHAKGALAIRFGENSRSAGYVGGGGTNKLLYRYRVKAGDTDDDGFSVGGSGLGTYDQGNITTPAGSRVEVALAGKDAGARHKVDGSQTGCTHFLCTKVAVVDVGGGTAHGAIYYTTGPAGWLSDRTLNYRGSNYVVEQLLVRDPNQLEIKLDRPPGQDLIAETTLVVDGTEFRLRDGRVNGNRISWSESGRAGRLEPEPGSI